MTDAQGVTQEGEFKLGQRHGRWTTTHPDGTVEHSLWSRDRLKQDQTPMPAPMPVTASAPEEPATVALSESVPVLAQAHGQDEMMAAADHSSSSGVSSAHVVLTTAATVATLSVVHNSDTEAVPRPAPSRPATSSPAESLTRRTASKAEPPSGVQFYSYADGTAYHGTLRKGLKHGYGVFLTADGHKISGQWREGRPHENMAVQYTNGDTYTGCIIRYLRHGSGVLTTAATGIKVQFLPHAL